MVKVVKRTVFQCRDQVRYGSTTSAPRNMLLYARKEVGHKMFYLVSFADFKYVISNIHCLFT
jgi:hypothetical protein